MFGRLWNKIFNQSSTKPQDGFARLSYFDQELNPLLARRVAELEVDLLAAQKEIQELKATRAHLEEFLQRFRDKPTLPDFIESESSTPPPASELETPL